MTWSALEAFGGDLSWVDSENYMVEAKVKLEAVFGDLVGLSKDDFDFDSCYQPYLVFVKFARNKIVSVGAGELGDLEKIWRLFWEEAKEEQEYSKGSFPIEKATKLGN